MNRRDLLRALMQERPSGNLTFTVEDLDRLPDDGTRQELLDGHLILTPRPPTVDRYVAGRLAVLLSDACPAELTVLPEPALNLGPLTEFVPDIVVVSLFQVGGAKLTKPPLLAVEVRSPATALIDLGRKKHEYAEFGVPSYWILNPGPAKPELTVFELQDGAYVTVAQTTAAVTLARPFAVTVDPVKLISKLRR